MDSSVNQKLNGKVNLTAYETSLIRPMCAEKVFKTGVSSGKLTANGEEAYRARAQLGKIKNAYGDNVKTRIVDRVEAGPGARAKVLELESANANRLKSQGHLDPKFHQRP